MQETVKLITSSEFKKGQVNSLPNVGDVQFNQEGVVEVPAEHGQLLVDLFDDLSFFEKGVDEPIKEEKIAPQTQEEDLTKSDDKDSLQPQVDQGEILGSVEPIVESEEVKEEVKEEKSEEVVEAASGAQVDPEAIKTALKDKSLEELREMVAKFDTEVVVPNKKQAIEYLVTKLS